MNINTSLMSNVDGMSHAKSPLKTEVANVLFDRSIILTFRQAMLFDRSIMLTLREVRSECISRPPQGLMMQF